MKRAVHVMSMIVLLTGIGLTVTPSPLTADTCTAGDGSKCVCVGTCSAGPAECHCNPPAT